MQLTRTGIEPATLLLVSGSIRRNLLNGESQRIGLRVSMLEPILLKDGRLRARKLRCASAGKSGAGKTRLLLDDKRCQRGEPIGETIGLNGLQQLTETRGRHANKS